MLQDSVVGHTYFSEELSSPAETLAAYSYSRSIIKTAALALSTVRGAKSVIGTHRLSNVIVFAQPGRLTISIAWPESDVPALQFVSKRAMVHFVPLFAWDTVVGAAGAGTVGVAYPETDTVFVKVNGVSTPDTKRSMRAEAARATAELMDVVIVGLNRSASPLLMTTLHELTHLTDCAKQRAASGPDAVERRLNAFPATTDRRLLINSGSEQSALMGELIAAYSAFLSLYRKKARKPFAKVGDSDLYTYVFDSGVANNARLSVEAFLSRVKNSRNPNAVLLYEPLLKPEARRKAAARLAAMHVELVSRLAAEPVSRG